MDLIRLFFDMTCFEIVKHLSTLFSEQGIVCLIAQYSDLAKIVRLDGDNLIIEYCRHNVVLSDSVENEAFCKYITCCNPNLINSDLEARPTLPIKKLFTIYIMMDNICDSSGEQRKSTINCELFNRRVLSSDTPAGFAGAFSDRDIEQMRQNILSQIIKAKIKCGEWEFTKIMKHCDCCDPALPKPCRSVTFDNFRTVKQCNKFCWCVGDMEYIKLSIKFKINDNKELKSLCEVLQRVHYHYKPIDPDQENELVITAPCTYFLDGENSLIISKAFKKLLNGFLSLVDLILLAAWNVLKYISLLCDSDT